MHLLRRLASLISWHRRVVAALSAAVVVAGIIAIASAPPPDGEPVVALQSDIPAGEMITAEHLTTRNVPAALITSHTVRLAQDAVGAQASVALDAGQILTDGMLLRGGTTQPGRALVPVAITDPDLRSLLTPGLTVSLIVALGEKPEVLGTARVATLPEAPTSTLGAGQGSSMIMVEVDADTAPEVATLGQSGQLSVVIGSA